MVALISIVFAITLLLVTVYCLHKYQNFEAYINAERSIPLPPLDGAEINNNPINSQMDADMDSVSDCEKSNLSGWMNEVAALKTEGNLDEAMAICEQEFPPWSAYNQATIILRGKLKDISPEEPQADILLKELYRIAVVAEILHEKSASSQHLSLAQLKLLALEELDGLNMDYDLLGYANLRLSRKSDVKLMLSLWGRPSQHNHPHSLHETWWNGFTSHV